jgi:hypothetical protein
VSRPLASGCALAFAPGPAPSVAASLAAFNSFVCPLERAQRTRSKAVTHRQTLLTWAIWKGVLPTLLPMSDDLVRAYIWDCLAFEASLSVLKHALDAIKGWHQHLGMRVPLDGPGDYHRITTSLSRFQPTHRILKFPIHKDAVRPDSAASCCWDASNNFPNTDFFPIFPNPFQSQKPYLLQRVYPIP